MKFSSLDLHADILKGVEDAGFEKCTPIQEQSLPEAIAGKDIIAQSQTGTGKTAVFLLTIFTRLLAEAKEGGASAGLPRALVMAPTRELAVQLDNEAKKLGKFLPFRSVAIYGGVDYIKQTRPLKEGVEIVLATPGRLIDLHKSRDLKFSDIDIFIIDEADRMFDMGFAPDINYIASKLPRGRPRQTMLFSATIDDNVHRLASKHMKKDYVLVEIEPEQVTVDKIDQKVLYISAEEKLPVLMALLNRPDLERAIIFTNMKRTAEMLEFKLKGNGYQMEVLTGDVSQSRRQRVIDSMKSGQVKILVATDVVARGLHIEDVSHVINYDLPQDAASYVHRIGRTARAGKSGKAYSLACEDSAWNLPEIEKYIEHKIEVEWVDDSELVEDKAGSYRRKRPGTKPHERKGGAKPSGGRKEYKGSRSAQGGGVSKASGSSSSNDRPRKSRSDYKKGGRDVKPGDAKGEKEAKTTETTGDREKKTSADRAGSRGRGSGRTTGKTTDKTGNKENGQSAAKDARPARRAGRSFKSKEDRMAYYKKKYGEDFGGGGEKPKGATGASGDARGGARGGSRGEGRTGRRSGRAKSASETPATRTDHTTRESSTVKQTKPAEPVTEKPKKGGVLKRILKVFGRSS